LRAEEYTVRSEIIEGWPVRLTSYRLGDRYHCQVDNVEPGAIIVRTEGASREEAEAAARERARDRLARTRRFGSEAG
jgi:hypothetical protein